MVMHIIPFPIENLTFFYNLNSFFPLPVPAFTAHAQHGAGAHSGGKNGGILPRTTAKPRIFKRRNSDDLYIFRGTFYFVNI
jgi:hypothetical protein